MTLAQISSLGRLLTAFLGLFADCFAGTKGRALFRVFVSGLLSDVQRKNVEAIGGRSRTRSCTSHWAIPPATSTPCSTPAGKPSSARFRPTFGCGWTRPAWSAIRRRNPPPGERVWSADGDRRKCVISADTHPPSTLNVRNAIASKTHSRGPTSGRFNGTRVGVVLRTDDS